MKKKEWYIWQIQDFEREGRGSRLWRLNGAKVNLLGFTFFGTWSEFIRELSASQVHQRERGHRDTMAGVGSMNLESGCACIFYFLSQIINRYVQIKNSHKCN